MSLEEIRKGIDRVDAQMRKLFVERMGIAEQVAQEKAKTEDVIFKPEREKIVIERNSQDVDPHVAMEYKAFLKRVMEVSRKYQYGRTLEMRNCFPFEFETEAVQFDAPAAVKDVQSVYPFAGTKQDKDSLKTADSYAQITAMIENGEADAGAGIISRVGRGVSEELNTMLYDSRLYINDCEVIEDGNDLLKIVRFSRHFTVKEEDDRLRIAFVCPNRSGSIAGLLSMIADYGVNVTEIHSIPYKDGEKGWNYRFYLELGANMRAKDVQALVFQLWSETEEFRILGSYVCKGDF